MIVSILPYICDIYWSDKNNAEYKETLSYNKYLYKEIKLTFLIQLSLSSTPNTYIRTYGIAFLLLCECSKVGKT